MLLSIEIKDNKASVFIEFLKNLDFVTIKKSELNETDHLELINERIAEYEKDPENTIDLKEFLNSIKAKYDL